MDNSVPLEEQLMHIEPNDLWLFAKIADIGSFSKASVSIGLPKSTLSRRISQLEKQLGERVFQRTTRQLNLTEFGLKLLRHGRQIGEDIDAAVALAQHRQLQPSGILRVSMPNDFANLVLLPLLAEFISGHPAISLEIDLSARRVDLLSEQYDLVIRMGDLPDDTSLAAKPVFQNAWGLYASNEYLDSYGVPEQPDDLCRHGMLQLLARQRELQPLQLTRGDSSWAAIVPAKVTANSPELLVKLALRHLGIVASPTVYANAYVKTGQLTRVLPEWQFPTVTAWAVFPGRGLMPGKTRALLDFLAIGLSKLK
ncbi:MAG: LysR family transcriptional regulator [Methylomonas sp.]|jgi:DNA-binding transcriptional LysR family regulator|uniref:LysR family transcriptional regulator n=1 Tax=Methylomonas sp. TaxID=418 RepID=UPI0025E5A0F4|nr:LysR family transcriptional regulator [Methylomonas sp.]MCK9608451.1 LysR family transcriptional regulator [Methylomonas sp.]